MRKVFCFFTLLMSLFISVEISNCSEQINTDDSLIVEENSAFAMVLDFNLPIEVNRQDWQTVTLGMRLAEEDTLRIPKDGQITLIFQDGTIINFAGPSTLCLMSISDRSKGITITNIIHSLVELFFASGNNGKEAHLGVRYPTTLEKKPLRVPVLIYPPQNCNLIEPPEKFKWQAIEGVLIYNVFLFDKDGLLWQIKTKNTAVENPPDGFEFEYGKEYIWLVEAGIGNEILRSEQVAFKILDENEISDFMKHLAAIDTTITDNRLAALLKIQLYRDYGIMVECYWHIERFLKEYPDNYSMLITKAELLEYMGLLDNAILIYKSLLSELVK